MTHPRSVRSAVYRLALARGISITGGAAAFTALMFAVYERTNHNPVWLAATLFGTAVLWPLRRRAIDGTTEPKEVQR